MAEEGLVIVPTNPILTIYDDHNKKHPVQAIISTGRFRSAISEELADQFELVDLEDLLWRQKEEIEGKVPVIEVKFKLKDRIIKTAMIVSKRLNRTKHKLELGRKDTEGFLIGETTT